MAVNARGRRRGIPRMVERRSDEGPPMHLSLESPVEAIDAKLASRRGRARRKGAEVPTAAEVLAEAFAVHTVGQLLHRCPRRYIDRIAAWPGSGGLKIGAYVTVIARVKKVARRQTRRRQSMRDRQPLRRHGLPRTFTLLQPALDRLDVPRCGTVAAVSGGRHPVPGTPAAREPGGGDPRSGQRIEDLVHAWGASRRCTGPRKGSPTRTIRELVYAALDRLPTLPDHSTRTTWWGRSASVPTTAPCATSISRRTRRR